MGTEALKRSEERLLFLYMRSIKKKRILMKKAVVVAPTVDPYQLAVSLSEFFSFSRNKVSSRSSFRLAHRTKKGLCLQASAEAEAVSIHQNIYLNATDLTFCS